MTLDMTDPAAAAALAARLHAGQTDKQGRDYVAWHLFPVAHALVPFGVHAVMAGWLHDSIEDTGIDADGLLEHGVPQQVVDAVAAVSRIKGEPYMGLIRRACTLPLARLVKLADNTVNLEANASLAEMDAAAARNLIDGRYLPARRLLMAGAEIRGADLYEMQVRVREAFGRAPHFTPSAGAA